MLHAEKRKVCNIEKLGIWSGDKARDRGKRTFINKKQGVVKHYKSMLTRTLCPSVHCQQYESQVKDEN